MTTSERLYASFEEPAPLTVGLEEELMLLDLETLDLAPVAAEVLSRLEGDARFKPELPAAQIELLTPPASSVPEAAAALVEARRDLSRACEGVAVPAGSGTHPFAEPEGKLNEAERYELTRREYGRVAALQLVFGLHVHVRVSGAERAVAVYNALRSWLPELSALAANAPFLGGIDTGLASVRPKIGELLPRQGIPPVLRDLDELAAAHDWGAATGTFPEARMWWWELRLHPEFGTVEVRVPDQQSTAGESAAVAAVIHSLVAQLAARHDAGERLPAHPEWQIAENRWAAGRHGLEAEVVNLETGERGPVRGRLRDLMDDLRDEAQRLGAGSELEAARGLVAENGAVRQRAAAEAEGGDPRAAAAFLAERFSA